MREPNVLVIGAGIGGLTAALELASRGVAVTVIERAPGPGGKMRQISVEGRAIDSGPTVLTMRWVFDQLFDAVGETFDRHVSLKPAEILARHAWSENERLDLFADVERSADAIATFSGAGEADGYRAFCQRARATYAALEKSFITAQQPTPFSLVFSAGLKGIGDLWRISPFTTLWDSLGTYFQDARLRQLFGRYATYCGSSPFEAPATLMLVAHVEQEGVWLVDGGMHKLACALERSARSRGADFHYGCSVQDIHLAGGRVSGITLKTGESFAADMVLVNADAAALAAGNFGADVACAAPRIKPSARSLSALTFSMLALTDGFPLIRHNVFFSQDYRKEFDEIFGAGLLPSAPTVYVCAEDRGAGDASSDLGQPELLFCIINAPPLGDTRPFPTQEIERCRDTAFALLQRCGLKVEAPPEKAVITAPQDFAQLYPATGGALYGQSSHGWTASFTRPTARTKIPGLYLAGGSTHPGPGVPMAALSGRLAAASILEDLTSAKPSRTAAMSGGMSTA